MDNVSSLLKAFVIGGGVLLVAGTIVLVVLIALRANQDPPIPATPAAALGPVDLVLPPGVRIVQMLSDGDRLLLLAEDEAGAQFLAVVDALTGERLSLIRVRAEP